MLLQALTILAVAGIVQAVLLVRLADFLTKTPQISGRRTGASRLLNVFS